MNATTRLIGALLLWLLALTAHAGNVTYVYTDPQGTPLAEADASGNITARFDYAPYGAASTASGMSGAPNGPGYTGHVNDPESGFVYMQARYYDPAVGKFLAEDPVNPSAGNVFSFNRYAYTNNNPINGTDPDGRQCAQCLYYGTTPAEIDRQANMNAIAAGVGLKTAAIALPVIPAAMFIGGTAIAVGTEALATGSLSGALAVNAPAIATSGALLGEGVAAANGVPSPMAEPELAMTPVQWDEKLTRNSTQSITVGISSTEAMENLSANGFSSIATKTEGVTVMSNGQKTYTFYPASTGGGVLNSPVGVPSASVQLSGQKRDIAKLRFQE